MEKIKIIIPVYNTDLYLERCLRSIVDQSFHDFHIILVDDGSTDCSPEICDRFARNDPRFEVVHQPNKGLSAARNTGLDHPSDCEYLAFVDSDDWLHPRCLEILYGVLRSTGTQMSIGGHIRTEEELLATDSSLRDPVVYSPEDCYCLTSVSTTPAWGKLYSSTLFSNIRFPEGKIHEDYYTTWKVLFELDRIAVIENPLYFYYYNSTGLMHSAWTPNRLDIFPALEEKIQYFQRHGYQKAQKRAIRKLEKTAEKYLTQIEETEYFEEYSPVIESWKEKCTS